MSITLGAAAAGELRPLTEVYRNDDFQLTGLAVSAAGRLFVNFPRWSDRYENAVIEVKPGGTSAPFPDETWNRWDLKPDSAREKFVCVQSIVVDTNDTLWILDAGAPLLGPQVTGGAKLVAVDLASNRVTRTLVFEPDVALPDSYMNDVRIDLGRHTAYVTDSGHGGLVVVDLESGSAWRALDGHPSVLVEPDVRVVVNGKELLQNGKPPQFQADGIAISPDGTYLYYKAVTANGLYRIATQLLREAKHDPQAAVAGVEPFARTFPTDGLWTDADGALYLSDVTHNAVQLLTSDGRAQTIVRDDRLQWPDTFTQDRAGAMYVSASHINESAPFNGGIPTRTQPYAIYRFEREPASPN